MRARGEDFQAVLAKAMGHDAIDSKPHVRVFSGSFTKNPSSQNFVEFLSASPTMLYGRYPKNEILKPVQVAGSPSGEAPPAPEPTVSLEQLSDEQRRHWLYLKAKGAAIGRAFSQSELKRAWRSLARCYHPDLNAHAHKEASQLLPALQQAYLSLRAVF